MEQKPLTPSFLHIFSIVRDGTRFGVYGDTLIVSPLQTFTKCISCLVNKRKFLLSWSFQSSHRIDRKACHRV